jgi:hypothetical protein
MNVAPNARRPTPYAALVAVVAAGTLTMPLSVSATTSVDAGDRNARVAEYLLEHRPILSEHNARVAEFLLLQQRSTVRDNARSAR